MIKKTISIIVMLMLSLSITTSAFCSINDLISFTLIPIYLETVDPTKPVTFQAKIKNRHTTRQAFSIETDYLFTNPVSGCGTIPWEPDIPSYLPAGEDWNGDFATFDFFDHLSPFKIQEIEFSVIAYTFNGGQLYFDTKYQTGTAALVPEPSLLLLGLVFFGWLESE